MSMRWMTHVALALAIVFLAAEQLPGQAMVEYGKQLEGVRQPAGPKASPKAMRSSGSKSTRESAPLPAFSLPAALSVKEDGTFLYAQQDEYAGRLETMPKAAVLTTIGQATANGEKWYMVRTQRGTIGWVKAVTVDDISKTGEAKSSAAGAQVKKSQ